MHVHAHTHTHTHKAQAHVHCNSFNPTPTRQGPDYQIFKNIKQYPHSLKFLQLIFFCYSSYTWAAHSSQKYSIWIISFSCWVRGIMAPFYVAKSFQFLPGMVKDQDLWIRSLHRWNCCSIDKGSGDTTMVIAHTLEGIFMRTSRVSGYRLKTFHCTTTGKTDLYYLKM